MKSKRGMGGEGVWASSMLGHASMWIAGLLLLEEDTEPALQGAMVQPEVSRDDVEDLLGEGGMQWSVWKGGWEAR